jgi:hypothetical protein
MAVVEGVRVWAGSTNADEVRIGELTGLSVLSEYGESGLEIGKAINSGMGSEYAWNAKIALRRRGSSRGLVMAKL